MKINAIIKSVLGIAMGLCFATPGYSDVVFTFAKGTAGNGTYTSGTGVGALDTNSLIVNINGASTTYSFTSGFFHISFGTSSTTADTLQITSSATMVETVGGVANSTFTSANVGNLSLLSNVTNLNEVITQVNPQIISNANSNATAQFSSQFLTDLGLSSLIGYNFGITAASFSSPFNSAGVISSDTLTFTATPEPSTIVLFASALIAIIAFGRKRMTARV